MVYGLTEPGSQAVTDPAGHLPGGRAPGPTPQVPLDLPSGGLHQAVVG